MLRITARKGGKAAAAYYLRDDAGNRAEGIAFGDLAKKMGMEGVVDHAQFAALCDNIDFRTGKKWTVRDGEKRNALFDLTFLEPKSFTLLRLLTGDERLEQARREALFETAAYIERDANTQWTLGPLRGKAKTGNIAAVAWFHDPARPAKDDGKPDPMGHCHLTILNGTEWNARIRSLNFRFGSNEYYAAIHSSILAKKTADLGYGVVKKGKYWEVEGVTGTLVRKFSRRQEESEEWLAKANAKALSKIAEKRAAGEELSKAELHVEKHGLTGKAVSQAGAASRSKKKHDMTLAELVDYWKSRLSEKEVSTLEGLRDAAMSTHSKAQPEPMRAVETALEVEAVNQSTQDVLPADPVVKLDEKTPAPYQGENAPKPAVAAAETPAPKAKKSERATPAQRKAENPPKTAVRAENTPAQHEGKSAADIGVGRKEATTAARAAVKEAWGEAIAKRKPELPYRKLATAAMQKIFGRAAPDDVHQAIDTCDLPRSERNGSVYLGRKPVSMAKRLAKWSGEKARRLKYEWIRGQHQAEHPAVRPVETQRAGVHR